MIALPTDNLYSAYNLFDFSVSEKIILSSPRTYIPEGIEYLKLSPSNESAGILNVIYANSSP